MIVYCVSNVHVISVKIKDDRTSDNVPPREQKPQKPQQFTSIPSEHGSAHTSPRIHYIESINSFAHNTPLISALTLSEKPSPACPSSWVTSLTDPSPDMYVCGKTLPSLVRIFVVIHVAFVAQYPSHCTCNNSTRSVNHLGPQLKFVARYLPCSYPLQILILKS